MNKIEKIEQAIRDEIDNIETLMKERILLDDSDLKGLKLALEIIQRVKGE